MTEPDVVELFRIVGQALSCLGDAPTYEEDGQTASRALLKIVKWMPGEDRRRAILKALGEKP